MEVCTMGPKVRGSTRKQAPILYVAVVVREGFTPEMREAFADPIIHSGRSTGTWSCFIGSDQTELIAEAMENATAWSAKHLHGYEVWIGTLTGLVKRPKPSYRVVKL